MSATVALKGRQRLVLGIAGVLWMVACVGGGTVLLRYASKPGEEGTAGNQWPSGVQVTPWAQGDNLVVAVHPHCPCTRASVVELNDLMLSLKGRVRATVLVIKPKGFPAGWEETDIVASARRIPGTTVLLDLDGTQAARFGAKTSGQAVLYDGSGKLLFSGGITEGRGHLGDNAGLQRIKSLVLTGKADKAESLVFGCPLSAKVCPMGKVESNQQSSKGEVHVQQSKL